MINNLAQRVGEKLTNAEPRLYLGTPFTCVTVNLD